MTKATPNKTETKRLSTQFRLGETFPASPGELPYEIVQSWRDSLAEGGKSWQRGERALPRRAAFEVWCAMLGVLPGVVDEMFRRVHSAASRDGLAAGNHIMSALSGKRGGDKRIAPASKHKDEAMNLLAEKRRDNVPIMRARKEVEEALKLKHGAAGPGVSSLRRWGAKPKKSTVT